MSWNENMAASSPAPARKKVRHFMLTGFSENEKKKLISIIQCLKAVYVCDPDNSETFVFSCTHMIARKPCRSQKFLCACASGKWVLVDRYLYRSWEAKKWLKESEFEWGGKCFLSSVPENMKKAPYRWRINLQQNKTEPPFRNWVVGIMTSSALSVYARLIEVGGGSSFNLRTEEGGKLTHVIADPGLSENVRKYHERGIPCLPCEYLALCILQDPSPPASEFSLFSHPGSLPLSITSNMSKTEEKFILVSSTSAATNDISADTDIKFSALHTRELIPAEAAASRTIKENNEKQPKTRDPSSQSSSQEVVSPVVEKAMNYCSFDETPMQETDLSKDVFKHEPADTVKQITSDSTKNTSVGSQDIFPTEQSASVNSKAISGMQSLHVSQKEVISDLTKQESNLSSAASAKNEPDDGVVISSTNTEIDSSNQPVDSVEMNVFDDPQTTAQQFSNKPKTPMAEEVDKSELLHQGGVSSDLQKKANTVPDRIAIETSMETQQTRQSDEVKLEAESKNITPPSRFRKRELAMMEGFVDAAHSRSLLLTCRMLITRNAYPPPDLIFLIMKKYVLESSCRSESTAAISFLNTLLIMHPPTASYIRNDDVYMKAFGFSDARQTSLLSLAKLSPSNRVRLWNNPELEPSEWLYLRRVFEQAAYSTDTQRRFNAVSLLGFLSGVLDHHTRLIKRIFWSKSGKSYATGAIASLLKFFRHALETDNKHRCQNDDGDEDMEEEDNSEERDSVDSSDCDDDDANDEIFVTAACVRFLAIIVNSWIRVNVANRRNDNNKSEGTFVASALAEAFSGADPLIVERILFLVDVPSKVVLIRLLLEKNFNAVLAENATDSTMNLQLIVQRYFRLIPKLSSTEAKHMRVGENVASDLIIVSADEENSTTSEGSSIASASNSASKLNKANVNRRNLKGETPLHKACMQNQPARVRELLETQGIDPNARDNAGWTPLSEACNHGHVDCVRALLRLPAAPSKPTQSSGMEPGTPRLEIDLLACPDEGLTPLHDAVNNGHFEVAKLLLDKGGVDLIYAADKQEKTPLDYCATEDLRSRLIEYACDVGSRDYSKDNKERSEDRTWRNSDLSPSEGAYDKVLPNSSVLSSSEWKSSCQFYLSLVRHLVSAYFSESGLFRVLLKLKSATSNDVEMETSQPRDGAPKKEKSGEPSSVSDSDMMYLLNWQIVEDSFKKHLLTLTGNEKTDFKGFSDLNSPFVKQALQIWET